MTRWSSLSPWLLCAAIGCALTAMPAGAEVAPSGAPAADAAKWPFWEAYKSRFLSADGRIIDMTSGGFTTSEGQSYALFFSLVANDRETFDRVLTWTTRNLAKGNLTANLPGWKWGELSPSSWGVVDANSAADADLWLAYTLVEAGRLWSEKRYAELGRAVAKLIVAREVRSLDGLGAMLLPAPEGFRIGERAWRLNPSYLPDPLLQGLHAEGVAGPWPEIAANAVRLIRESSPKGFVADWVAYESGKGFAPDPITGSIGSHDAIRCYLWAGAIDDEAAAKAAIDSRLHGMLDHWRRYGRLPEKINAWNDIPLDASAPVGFLGALLPELQTKGSPTELHTAQTQIELFANNGLYGNPAVYYDQNLLLFGKGFVESRFRFGPDGLLQVKWKKL
jgi:endoglucanase